MRKLLKIIQVFRKGRIVANPEAWKNGQITVNVLVGFISAVLGLASAFGYPLAVAPDVILQVATAVLAVAGLLFNPVATVVSSKKVGLPSDGFSLPDTNTENEVFERADDRDGYAAENSEEDTAGNSNEHRATKAAKDLLGGD